MAEKVTIMKLKVDLECERCYMKVKKLLAKYPQIRDQKFDEKENIVMIAVVCCSPEMIRDKLCCKGGGSIKSIEILEPPKPVEPKEEPKHDKPKEPKPKDPKQDKPKEPKPNQPPVKPPDPPVLVNQSPPAGICCAECSEGRPGGPCLNGYIGPLLCYDGYYGRPVCGCYGWGRPYCYVSRCCQYYYFSEENVSVCTIM